MADLVVDLYGWRIGRLVGDWRSFDFIADAEAVGHFGLDSPMLSVAIPLSAVAVRARKERRQNFFRELLPEGAMLRHLAERAQVDEHDIIGFLRTFGRDLAGALQIWDPDLPGEPLTPSVAPVTDAGIAAMLDEVRRDPLGNRPPTGKTSLAGVQDKIVLARLGDSWHRAQDGWPSSHILKPVSREHPSMIFDEEYGARLARSLGLTSFATAIMEFDGVPALVIERYDRSPERPDGRIHQEDFNQALGARGIQKYQQHGGRVSLSRIAQVVTTSAGSQARSSLFALTVLSVAAGNLDLHAKNLSLLHHPDGEMSLAPAYDVVPQAHQPNDQQMALAIDGEYRHAAITLEQLAAEGRAWGIDNAPNLAEAVLEQILELVRSEHPDPRAHPQLAQDIEQFASNLLGGRPAGTPSHP